MELLKTILLWRYPEELEEETEKRMQQATDKNTREGQRLKREIESSVRSFENVKKKYMVVD